MPEAQGALDPVLLARLSYLTMASMTTPAAFKVERRTIRAIERGEDHGLVAGPGAVSVEIGAGGCRNHHRPDGRWRGRSMGRLIATVAKTNPWRAPATVVQRGSLDRQPPDGP